MLVWGRGFAPSAARQIQSCACCFPAAASDRKRGAAPERVRKYRQTQLVYRASWKSVKRYPLAWAGEGFTSGIHPSVATRLAASSQRIKTGQAPSLQEVRVRSRPVCGLTERGRGVLGKLLLGGLRSLDLELVEQKRRAGDAEPDGLRAVFDGGRGSGGDEIAAQRADVEISED